MDAEDEVREPSRAFVGFRLRHVVHDLLGRDRYRIGSRSSAVDADGEKLSRSAQLAVNRRSGTRNQPSAALPRVAVFTLKALGTVGLTGSEGEVLVGRRKELALLAYLTRGPDRVSRDELATLLWSERQQARARHSLRQVLLRLRRTLGEDAIAVEGDVVTVDADAVEIDASRFEARLAEGRHAEAVALWGGDFLAGMDDVGGEPWHLWLHAQRESLFARLVGALEHLVRSARADRGAAEALRWAERWTELQPLAEHPVTVLTDLLREEGRSAEALGHIEALVARRARELEAEASPALVALQGELEEELSGEVRRRTPRSVALFTPELVGRAPALASLAESWRLAASGAAVVVVVEGEVGIGKTRLCDEFVRSLAADLGDGEWQLFRARATEGCERYSTVRELLSQLANAPGLGGVSDAAMAELAALVPSIRGRFEGLREATGDSRALAGAVREAISMVAEEVPTLLLLDEVSLVDEGSRVALDPTLSSPPPGVMVVVTVSAFADAFWLRETTSAGGRRRHLRLGPLGAADMEALLVSMLELSSRDRGMLAARLHDECGGNPLFAVELVSGLVDEGHLIPDANGIWRPSEPDVTALSLPRSLRETIRMRLGDLSEPAKEVACVAAFLREPVELRRLGEVVGLRGDHLRAAVEELLAARLLREAPMRPGTVEFLHAIVRRVAAELLSPGGRRALAAAGVYVHAEAAAHHLELDEPPSGGRAPQAAHDDRRRESQGMRATIAVVCLVAVALGGWRILVGGRTGAPAPLLAIGGLVDLRQESDSAGTDALSDMLATNLARVPGLQVVSSARMYELMGQLASGEARRAALAGAAREAGADQLLEGSILDGPGGIRLDLRRVDLRSGAVLHGDRVDGSDLFELVDMATSAVATGLGLRGEALHLADATTSSLVAYGFYEEGLRRYASADYRAARQLFDAAVAQDSSFALALYYRWRSRVGAGMVTPQPELDHMLEVAARAPERDRLLIRGSWAVVMNDPRLSAVADTLAIRYPAEPEGQYLVGVTKVWEGSFAQGRDALARVVAMDSLGLRGTRALCLACDALELIVEAEVSMDSAAAAERTARGWIRVQPTSARAWQSLAAALLVGERFDEADQARARATELNPIDTHDAVFPAIANIYEGKFAEADALLTELGRSGVPDVEREALWFLAISLRNQGSFAEALRMLRARTAMLLSRDRPPLLEDGARRHEAQVLFEMGHFDESAALFDSLTQVDGGRPPGVEARQRVLNLTGLATALAAAGDTLRLGAIADTVDAWGRRSAYGRDQRLSHHVRGLLFAARGGLDAAEEEFRAAMYSPTAGYTRTNLELAKVLLQRGRPAEAAAILSPALRAQLEGSNLYVTRTELRLWLGRAWDAAGVPDSAQARYQAVVDDWASSDPPTRVRADSVRARMTQLRGGR